MASNVSAASKIAIGASRFAAPFGQRFGPGGRHSVSGIKATVFGAYGFLGKYICHQLGTTLFAALVAI